MRSLSILLCLIPLSLGAEIVTREQARQAFADDANEPVSNREDKFLSVFRIVKFNNENCNATDGNDGVCFTQAECSAKGGVATGSCASSYGVCCVFRANECGGEVNQLVSYIESPNYPAPAPTGMCMFNIAKCDAGVCQYKIEFEDVMLSAPDQGDCTNDTMLIMNVDPVSSNLIPMNLCGVLSGQEIYVTVKATTVPPKISFNIASDAAKWRIKVTQIACKDEDKLAPPGCLTYATEEVGEIMSFNNQGGMGELLNNAKFAHCIKYREGFCDISFSASDFMLGADDSIAFGTNLQTGATFGDANQLRYNFTGPYVFPTCSGADNMAMDTGYKISYLLLPC